MPAVDDPFSIAASLPGQMATMRGQLKDLSVSNTQALTLALTAASAAAASASAAATSAYNAQVSPAVGANSTSGFSLGTAFGDVTSFSFTVPTGYTRALISAAGSVTAIAATGGSGILESRIVIAGTAGALGGTQAGSPNAIPVPSFSTASLTGLTAGGTVTVTIQAFASGPTSTSLTNATVAGTALFLR